MTSGTTSCVIHYNQAGDGGYNAALEVTETVTAQLKNLTITADSTGKAYGTTLTFAGTEFSTGVGELVTGDSVTSVTLTSAGAAATATVAGSPYSIVPSAAVGTGLGNYSIGYVDGTLTVATVSTTTSTVLNLPSSSIVGDSVTFTATVSGGYNPTGTVNFESGSTIIGTATLSGSTAVFSTSGLAVGNYQMTAHYLGDGNNYPSTSATTVLQVVDKDTPATSTAVGVPNSSTVGDPVTITATVSGGFSPSGDVEFLSGSTVLGTGTLSGGSASLIHTFTTAGDYALTAHYVGDGNNYGSTSASAPIQVVDKASPTTNTVLSAPNSSIVGDPVTLTGSVTGGYNPTGSIEFFDGITSLGSATLSGGKTSISFTFTTVGTHSLTATYSGDANNNTSTSATADLQVVDKASPTTNTVLSAPNSSIVGDPVTLTGSVTGGYNPTGSIEFFDGVFSLGTGALVGGSVSIVYTFTSVGTHSLTATYSGDANNNTSTSATADLQVVNKASSSTSTAIGVPNSSVVGDSVTFTALVSGGYNPTGDVVFQDNGIVIGTGSLLAGTATFSTSSLTVGDHPMTAEYLGDINNLGSTSSTSVIQVVDQSASVTTVTSSTNLSYLGSDVTFRAVVTGVGPTGDVAIRDAGTTIGTITLSNGSGSFTTSSLALGTHPIDAAYAGDTNNLTSVSDAVSVVVIEPVQGPGSSGGHSLKGFSSTVAFMLGGTRNGGRIARGAFGGAPTGGLTQQQKDIICAVQKSV
ncbi:MAG: Ig-like domain-containing protein, partial [Candidatus Peribacteraceae bacterium]|nr:Ig-like domain-containing protein [Candidatus Peribacteraceae bacterium]